MAAKQITISVEEYERLKKIDEGQAWRQREVQMIRRPDFKGHVMLELVGPWRGGKTYRKTPNAWTRILEHQDEIKAGIKNHKTLTIVHFKQGEGGEDIE